MNCLAHRTIIQTLVALTLVSLFFSCQPKKTADSRSDEELQKLANDLAHRYLIMDGHIDLPWVLNEKKFRPDRDKDTIMKTGKGDFDYERAVKGGLSAPFMSIYVPASYQKKPDYGKAMAESLIDIVHGIAHELPTQFALAVSPEEVDKNFAAGRISLPMGMENGAPIGTEINNLKHFFDLGIRYITLTHNRDNQICDSSGDTTHTWGGLSPFGKDVVQEMNRLGIMVDISHVDDSTFYQVMKLTKVPCIASHSSCRAFAPKVRRDMTDDMIKALGKNKGVMLVNFYTAFLDSSADRQNTENSKKTAAILRERHLTKEDSLATVVENQVDKDNPFPVVDISVVANHIDHIVKLIGVDHVGFGSDFDGVDEHLPVGLTDVSMFPNLIYVLLKRGYSEADIEKICGGNFRRVWVEVQAAAKNPSTEK